MDCSTNSVRTASKITPHTVKVLLKTGGTIKKFSLALSLKILSPSNCNYNCKLGTKVDETLCPMSIGAQDTIFGYRSSVNFIVTVLVKPTYNKPSVKTHSIFHIRTHSV